MFDATFYSGNILLCLPKRKHILTLLFAALLMGCSGGGNDNNDSNNAQNAKLVYFTGDDGTSGIEPFVSDGTAAGTRLLKDINQNTDSLPTEMVVFNGAMYFAANGSAGRELWKTDGTVAGTAMVKDIVAGDGHASPRHLVPMGESLFFIADGSRLWKTDGTDAGTILVKAIGPSTNPRQLTAVGATLFFVAGDAIGGIDLWKSDGTEAGTVVVRDTPIAATGSRADRLTAVGNLLFFVANDGTTGIELWKSDGTPTGTGIVKDLKPGVESSGPANLVAVGDTLFFTVGGLTSEFLWQSNGTPEGTLPVPNVFPAPPTWLTAIGTTLYFVARDTMGGTELWKSDNTGIARVKDIVPGTSSSNPAHLTAAGTNLFFSTGDAASGYTLWMSNGTEAGTVPITTVPDISFDLSPFLVVGNTCFFIAADSGGDELWKTDGTAAGTKRVKDIFPGIENGMPRRFMQAFGSFENAAYFAATDGIHGVELWRSDGTESGTTLFFDVRRIGGDSLRLPRNTVVFNGIRYFTADNGLATQLWKSDGTTAGTSMVTTRVSVHEFTISKSLVVTDNAVYFVGSELRPASSSGAELWKTDGTDAGTVRVKDIAAGTNSSEPGELTAVGDTLYFVAQDDMNGRELWKSDGSENGTVLVKDIVPEVNAGNPRMLTAVGDSLYFVWNGLWKSNGTESSTVLVHPLGVSALGNFTASGNTLFFTAQTPTGTAVLWKSDGTLPGTHLVKDFATVGSSAPHRLFAFGDILVFSATGANRDGQLWKSDGTEAGTRLLKDFGNVDGPARFTTMGNAFYFTVSSGLVSGPDLWKSDGTEAGTLLVKHFPMGGGPADMGTENNLFVPVGFTVVNNLFYFTAVSIGFGRELWKSDGTDSGTELVFDVKPGPGDGALNLMR